MSHAFVGIALALIVVAASGCGNQGSQSAASQTGPTAQTTTDPAAAATTGELQVGAKPSIPVKGYWFGPVLGEAKATAAREIRSHRSSLRYDVYYELPSAAGKTSAQPGQAPPPGEIRVVSMSLRGAVLRQTVARYKQGKQAPITLASGEHATFFPFPGPSEEGFAVVTGMTLIQVFGPGVTLLVEEERKAVAVRLRAV